MESIITVALGTLAIKPINKYSKIKLPPYDTLFAYHDRYLENDSTIDIIGFSSTNKYALTPNEIYRSRVVDINKDSTEQSISIFNIKDYVYKLSPSEYIKLNGFIDYVVNCDFKTTYVEINLSSSCEVNIENIRTNIKEILEILNNYIKELGIQDIVELEYTEDIKTDVHKNYK